MFVPSFKLKKPTEKAQTYKPNLSKQPAANQEIYCCRRGESTSTGCCRRSGRCPARCQLLPSQLRAAVASDWRAMCTGLVSSDRARIASPCAIDAAAKLPVPPPGPLTARRVSRRCLAFANVPSLARHASCQPQG
jgi:hypothetical protein